jgi:hypothetical protein
MELLQEDDTHGSASLDEVLAAPSRPIASCLVLLLLRPSMFCGFVLPVTTTLNVRMWTANENRMPAQEAGGGPKYKDCEICSQGDRL